MRRQPSLVTLANKHVRIELACRLIGLDVPDVDTGESAKTWCPFGDLYHPDGGTDPAMRLYPESNHAWCFACSEYFTPVRLCAVTWHKRYEEVAVELLRQVDYKPASYAQHWQAVTAADPDPGRAEAAQALGVWASRLPEWGRLQYDPQVAGYYSKCLGLLEVAHTPADIQEWLEGSKRVVRLAHERAVAGERAV